MTAIDVERCQDCFRPLATREQYRAHEDGCECVACLAVCWRKWDGDRCQREPSPADRLAAERARFEDEAKRRGDLSAAEKERHWQTWCAAVGIER